jgi:YidC/Oxa1 family membrane protein insertase
VITDIWNLLIVNPMMNILVFIYSIVGNYGVAILIFTILIKVVTLPFTMQQQKAMKAQMAVAPKMEAIKKKFAKDPQKLQQAQLELYKTEGINPLSGCLPMLIPWPIFVAFYQSVQSVMSTQPEQFMQLSQHILPALAKHVPVNEVFLWLNLSRPDPLFILPVLAGVTTWIQQQMMQMPSSDAQSQSMNKTMGIFMPIFMGYITWSFASGLAVYWVAFNIIGIIQQYFITGWGELGKKLPAAVLKVLPGPKNMPVVLPAPIVEPEAKANKRPSRDMLERVDQPKPKRQRPVDGAASEPKPTRRKNGKTTAAGDSGDEISDEPTPSAAALPPIKARRKAPPQQK